MEELDATRTEESAKAAESVVERQVRAIMGRLDPKKEAAVGRRVECIRCKDLRVIEFIGGTYNVGWTHSRPVKVEATPEHPVYKQCKACKPKPKTVLADQDVEEFD